ncbi:ABC transporter ATP-binding protein [Portibacter marinus]|uniref:ABC transporter ATP-binding protein n=1 Tax=Portibacter marinus TaxID=2898660 RepID=UPI001F27BBB5
MEKGETVGIIGKNGAGKSTLLKILSKITPPSEGSAIIHGRVSSLLEVGTGFHPELTGRENIFLNGSLLGMKNAEIRSKLSEIIAFSGIGNFIDTPVKKYSSGMYVRLAFSVAAHLNSDVLFIDEILSVGDYEFQQKCLGKINSLSSEMGKTVLMVSHNFNLIRSFCNRTIKLENGRIAMDDVTSIVLSKEFENTSDHLTEKLDLIHNLQVRQVGDSIEIILDYHSEKEVVFPNFSFVVSDIFNRNIFGGNTMYAKPPDSTTFPKKGTLRIVITEPVLTDGDYNLSIWFGINKFKQPIESINILKFSINGMAKLPFKLNSLNYGAVIPKWKFDVAEN